MDNDNICSSNTTAVSVILPVYNAEKTLCECLETIVKQSLTNIEIICINDGSTDNSLSVLEKFAQNDNRIKIVSQENKGPSSTRNLGINIAKGEYISFIDADDKIDLDFLEKLYVNAKNTNSEIACSSIVMLKNNKKRSLLKVKKIKTATKTKDKYKLAGFPQRCFVWNKIYKKDSLIKKCILFETDRYYEDIIFTPVVLHYLGKMVAVPNTNYYYYRDNASSITGQCSSKHEEDFKYTRSYVQKFVQDKGIMKGVGKHWQTETVFELNILGIPIFRIKRYGVYYQVILFYIPLFLIKIQH